MRSPILNWTCGIVALLGLPLGVIVALSYGSLLAGLGSTITVVCVVMLACRRDIFQEYHQKNNTPPKKSNG